MTKTKRLLLSLLVLGLFFAGALWVDKVWLAFGFGVYGFAGVFVVNQILDMFERAEQRAERRERGDITAED